jgi:hypothetical protein
LNKENQILGIVQEGKLVPLSPEVGAPLRLTRIKMLEARPPESGELEMKKYESMAIMASYQGSGGEWLYSAKVVDKATPILTEVVKKAFGAKDQG